MAHRILRMGKLNVGVADLDRALDFFEDAFQAERLRRRGDFTAGRRADGTSAFSGANMRLGGMVVDFVSPNTPESPLGRLLASRGEGLLSICFEVEHFGDSVAFFEARGLQVVDKIEIMDNKIGFIRPEQCHGVMVEIIERPSWWTWRDEDLTPEAMVRIQELIAQGKGRPTRIE